MRAPIHLAQRLAMVHLGFGLLCALLAIPYLAAAAQTWWQAQQFADFGPYVEVLGALPIYRTGSAFIITPVVALVQPGFTLQRRLVRIEAPRP